jgi:hypothetical protein
VTPPGALGVGERSRLGGAGSAEPDLGRGFAAIKSSDPGTAWQAGRKPRPVQLYSEGMHEVKEARPPNGCAGSGRTGPRAITEDAVA